MRRQRLVYLRWKIWAIEVRLLDAFKGSQSIWRRGVSILGARCRNGKGTVTNHLSLFSVWWSLTSTRNAAFSKLSTSVCVWNWSIVCHNENYLNECTQNGVSRCEEVYMMVSVWNYAWFYVGYENDCRPLVTQMSKNLWLWMRGMLLGTTSAELEFLQRGTRIVTSLREVLWLSKTTTRWSCNSER